MGYVFISYSSKNQTSADAIRELFNKNSIDTWMAPNDIPAGSSYMGEINRALSGCSCLVLLLSEASQSSQWVLKELERAVSYKKTIIPVKIEDVILNDDFEFALGSCHVVAIQKVDKNSAEVKNILKSVIACTGVSTAVDMKEAMTITPKKEPEKQSPYQRPVTKPESPRANRNYEKKPEKVVTFTDILKEIDGSLEIKRIPAKGFYVFQELKKLPADAFYPHNILLRENLTENKKKQFRNAMKHIAKNPHLMHTVAVIDTTIFKSGKEGFVFTDECMYCYKNKTRFSVKFEDIELATADDVYLYIKFINGTSDKYMINEKRIAKLLNAISTAVKKEKESKNKTETEASHASEGQPTEVKTDDTAKSTDNEANSVNIPEGISIKDGVMTVSSMEYVPDNFINRKYNFTSVHTLILKEGITEIKLDAFSFMKELKTVILPKGLEKIGRFAFAYCENLDSVVIPEGTTCIESHAFEGCINLKSISIPDTVKFIGIEAFQDCQLKNVTVSKDCKVELDNPGIIKATD